MNIEQKIKALLEGIGNEPTSAQLSYPGATNPQDPAPYGGVPFQSLELDRPGVHVGDTVQQFMYPGQTMPDPMAIPPEFEELDPYNIGATIAQVDKEHYPVGSGANDVVIPPDNSSVPGSEQYNADIQQAAKPAPFVAESVEEDHYTLHRHNGINGASEGPIVPVTASIEKVATKIGADHADLHSDDKQDYSHSLVLKDKKGNKFVIYSRQGQVRVRAYGHGEHDETRKLAKFLNEETEDQGQDAKGQTEGNTPNADEQAEILQQAVAAVQAGNDINDVSKATGIPVDQLQQAVDSATPTQAPNAATNSPAPVTESVAQPTDRKLQRLIGTAYEWHGGQSSPLYSFASTGGVVHDDDHRAGLVNELQKNIDWCNSKEGLASPEHKGEAKKLQTLQDYVKNAPLKESIAPAAAKDIASLFEGEDYSDEFKSAAADLFESAVIARVNAEVMRLEEAYKQKTEETRTALNEEYNTAVSKFVDVQSARLNQYVTYLGESWLKQNKVAIINEARNAETEKFMRGVRNLLESASVAVDDKAANAIAEKDAEIKSLRESLEQATEQVHLMESAKADIERAAIIEKASADLTDMDRAKLTNLCEGIEFVSAQSFADRISKIKVNFFARSVNSPEALLESNVHMTQPQDIKDQKPANPEMAQYVQALNRFKSR